MIDRLEFDAALPRIALWHRSKNPRVVSGLWFCPDHKPDDILCVRIGGSRITCACRLLEHKPDGLSVLRFHATIRTRGGYKWMRFCRESEVRPARVITRRLLNMSPRLAPQPLLFPPHYGQNQAALLAVIPVPSQGPRISVLMPVFNPPLGFLAKAIASVRAQTYPNWELCIANDASTDLRVRELLDREASCDPRIKIVHRPVNGHISAASNSALTLASGEWCALLDQDDELAPQAFTAFIHALLEHPNIALVYSDENKISADERHFDPYFKSGWMPELLLGQNFVSHLGIYRTDHLRAIGGFREGYEGCQDWDLVLRYTRDMPAERILHLPFVLYHWRVLPGSTAHSVAEKPYVVSAALRTVTDALAARSLEAKLTPASPGQFHVAPASAPPPSVTVLGLNDPAHRTRLTAHTAGATLHFIDSPGIGIPPLAFLLEASRTIDTDLILLMSPDWIPRQPDWLARLAASAVRPGVAASGGCLVDTWGYVVSGCLGLDSTGKAAPIFEGQSESDPGYFGRAHFMHNPESLDLRSIVLRRETILRLGPFALSPSASPVSDGWQLCAALRATGARLIHDPGVRLDFASRQSQFRRDGEITNR